jgi:regulator of protease activity HflC (stomatin/prohibitin superfamily)
MPTGPRANSSPTPPQEPTRNQKENGVFPKLIILIVATVAALNFPATQGYAVPLFILGAVIVFVAEGVRIVPQQNAWVVERLGKYHAR